ncbi:MAG: hypothetical protein AAFR04_09210 [Pseudomonadota bacterium]
MALIFPFIPALSIAGLVLIAVLPWGVSAGTQFFLPLLPIIAIHYWSVRATRWMPFWFVFLAGLTIDVLTHGPLGLWALIYLIAAGLAVRFNGALLNRTAVGGWIVFALTMLATAVAQWGVISVYFLRPFEAGPLLIATLGAIIAYPLIAGVLAAVRVLWRQPEPRSLLRGD